MSESPFIKVVNAHTFNEDVLKQSAGKLVLVDFWAGWCNPCKILMPILSKLADEYQGQFILAKVDTDAEQQLATQYGVRSLPTVKVFKHGEIVDEFMGVIPEPEIRAIIERNLPRETDFMLRDALAERAAGNTDNALELLQQAHSKDQQNKPIAVALADLLLAKGKTAEAETVIHDLGMTGYQDEDVENIKAKLVFAKTIQGAADIATLEKKVANDDTHCDAYLQLGAHYAVISDYEKSLQAFLHAMQIDRSYQDGAARKGMLAVFTLLGGRGPLVNTYRSKMASMLH